MGKWMNFRAFFSQRRLAWLTASCVLVMAGTAAAAQTACGFQPDGALTSPGQSFQQLDTNRDGFLSREETRALREFDPIFTEADENRDNRLGADEFAKAQVTCERQRLGRVIGDGVITAKIKAALLKDPLVSTSDVNIATYKGSVQLLGFVDSERQARRAAEVAAGVDG